MMGAVDAVDLWSKVDVTPLMAPVSQKLPGRPKKYARRKEADENFSQKSSHTQKKEGEIRLRKKGAIMKCSSCGGANHNIRDCPNAKDKREREIPAAHEISAPSQEKAIQWNWKGKKTCSKKKLQDKCGKQSNNKFLVHSFKAL
ncbi:zinc knuckle (CCHC-type) family protein [Striga asiatica]|uniref:Zinc knuckle (CCHC-type) family protein n=1 Tax=Striga asiatica TaxID=4170 RepID=A0A5A7QLI0_STRAF|nr:zinc knuckle (CCHC-type) family protein [Striga asiatica]